MKVLVTGAGGFIGSHLVEHLVERGCAVRAFVHYRSDRQEGWLRDVRADRRREAVEVVPGDVRDADHVRRVAQGCAIIYHLAAQISIAHSYEAPAHALDTNGAGTLSVLQAARAHGCRVLHMSTCEVYGSAQHVPMDEGHPINAQSPYAASKVAADQMCLAFRRSYGTDVRVVRPFNTYGPRQSLRAVIPNVVGQVMQLGRGGSCEVSVGSTNASRDFTYVTDTVRALRLVAEAPGAVQDALNVCSQRSITVGDLVALVGEVFGVSAVPVIERRYVRPADSEVSSLIGTSARLRSATGWEPTVALRDGILHVAAHLRPLLAAAPGRVA